MDVENGTPARPLGETLWLGLDGSRLTVSRSPEALEIAHAGDETLGDDPTFAALADALDAHDTHTALLTRARGTVVGGIELSSEMCETMAESALAETPTGVAAGQASDGNDQFVVLALTHADTDATEADADADAVERIFSDGVSLANQPWTDIVTLQDVEVVDDTTVVATLEATENTPPNLWHRMIENRDGPTAPAC